MTTCQRYQIPVITVSMINLLFIWALSHNEVLPSFFCIVAFFSFMNLCFAKAQDKSISENPHKFMSCFVAGKVIKFLSTLVLVFGIATFFDHVFLVSLLSVCVLYLTTLLVDLAMFVKYVNSY